MLADILKGYSLPASTMVIFVGMAWQASSVYSDHKQKAVENEKEREALRQDVDTLKSSVISNKNQIQFIIREIKPERAF